ncbi:hypothetical protein [Streptomyces cremeus]|uniref:Uncharacterized protein n=1 Tax=Streptomyces cremeus TaxID=66881 RepID=A0ABV5PCQ7_STRCM
MAEAQTETTTAPAQGVGRHRGGPARYEDPSVAARGRHRRDPAGQQG